MSGTRLSGIKFWKALIWKYSAQLLAVEEVPEYMKEVEKSGNLVTANHVSRNRKNITCSACFKHLIHKRALSQFSNGTTFDKNVEAHMEPFSEPTE